MREPEEQHPLASTGDLITHAQAGDQAARDQVLVRYREPLARFLRGRLAPSARSAMDTGDVVQATLTAALQQLEHFEYRGLGSFWAYLRRIGINLILQEQRKRGIPRIEAGESAQLSGAAGAAYGNPPDSLLRKESLMALEAALEKVPEQVRSALLLRLELGLSYEVVARECGYPSPDAARMAIGRAMGTLASDLSAFKP